MGKTFPAFPAHAQITILRIWQEAHWFRGFWQRHITVIVQSPVPLFIKRYGILSQDIVMSVSPKFMFLVNHIILTFDWHLDSIAAETNGILLSDWTTINRYPVRLWGLVRLGSTTSKHWVNKGLYSISGKTFYHQISLSFEAAKLDVIMIVSLWNLTGISAALPPVVCLISDRLKKSIPECHYFKFSRGLAVRCPSVWWIEDQYSILPLLNPHGDNPTIGNLINI